MTYRTILVHLDRSKRRKQRLEIAIGLAERFDAHLTGLFVLEPMFIPSFAAAEAGRVVAEVESRARADATREAENEFRAATANRPVRANWSTSADDPVAALSLAARYADLVVAGQPEGEGAPWTKDLIVASGRPVLFVPYAGKFTRLGNRVLVAWDEGREAARAVTDALPFLAKAAAVDVVRFNPPKSPRRAPDTDVAAWLARHGVKATLAEQTVPELAIGEQILSRAADFDADLLVMGAYAHSRVRDLVLGGATRTLLGAMTVPVLMSH